MQVYVYIEQARDYLNQLQFDSAIMYFDSALKTALILNDETLEAHITRLKGRAFILSGQDDSALVYLDKAIDLAQKLENDTILAIAYINMAYVWKDRGMIDSAMNLYNESLRLYESANDSIGIGRVHTSLAIHYKYSGDFDLGLKSALIAKYIFSKLKIDAALARSYINLGNIYEKLGDYDTALACFESSYQIGQKINRPQISLTSLINQAVMYWHRGNTEMDNGDSVKAIESYKLTKDEFLKSIEFSKNINDQKTLTMLYSNISLVYRDLGMYEEAIESAKESLRISKNIKMLTDQQIALNNLGVAYQTIKQYKNAEKSFLESLEIARKSKQKESIENACSSLSILYELTGDYKKSLKYIKLSAAYKDSIFNEVKQREIEKHKTNFEILHLKDLNQIKELDKKRMRAERNVVFGLSAFIVVVLLGLLIFLRMRARKNRIIAAQKIQKLEDEKKLMAAQSVLVGQEKERERIARELHDGIGVLLSTASIHFSSVEEKADKETGEMLKKANKLLKEAGKEVRHISHNMMPGVLSKFGLKEAIEDLFEVVDETGDIKVDLHLTCGEERLAENMEIMIFRVIQEMLNNSIKHAEASRISLYVTRGDEEILIDYEDNGVGFDENKLPFGKNLGLSGIRSRIEYLGGKLKLQSEKDQGVKYIISIPISEKLG